MKNTYFKTKEDAIEFLLAIYEVAKIIKSNPLLLEAHVEEPFKSEIFKKYPVVLGNERLISFICDTLKVQISSRLTPEDINELMANDILAYKENLESPTQFARSAIFAIAKGCSPKVVVEYARRTLPERIRPSLSEMDCATSGAPKIRSENVKATKSTPLGQSGEKQIQAEFRILELEEKLSKAQSQLDQYSVIEDDLANLKRFMQENAELKKRISKLEARK